MNSTDYLQLFKTIFQQSPVSTQVFTPDGETVLVNAAWEKVWNVTFAQVKQYNILQDKQLIETGTMAYIHRGFAGEIVTIPPIKYDATRTIDIAGMIPFKWLQAIMYPIRDDAGEITLLVLQHEDITEQKEAQEHLQISEERLRLALKAGKIGVWDWDILNNIITWSDRVYEFYEAIPKTFAVTYENFQKQLHPDDAQRAQEAIEQAVAGTVPYNVTYRIVTLKGKVCWIASSATVTRDASGNPLRMLGATIDVTEQKKVEQDKSDFVSIATHELKTPVTSLKAYAEVLQRSFMRRGDTHSATQLGKMNTQLDKLTNLISDLLDATKIEAGKLAIRKEKFDIDHLIEEIVGEMQRTTEKQRLVITRKIKKKITADRERIGQVLTNLLSNAIKYSPADKDIRITASATVKQIQVSVKDVGVGITQSKQKHLFDRFYRISGPKKIRFQG